MALNKAFTYGESQSILDSEVGIVAKTRTATQAMAITRPHTTTLSASTERRSASEMVYFLTELMKIKELK